MSAILTLGETCTPLMYSTTEVAALAQRLMSVPKEYRLVSFSAFVEQSTINAGTRTIVVQAIVYLKQSRPTTRSYHFAGK